MNNYRTKNAYTLIEVGVSLIILAFISLGVVGTMNYTQTVRTKVATVDKFEIIETALVSFLAANGRLPCPANPALDVDDDQFGFEAKVDIPGAFMDCNQLALLNTLDVANQINKIYMGMPPVSTLGLDPEFAFDGNGNRISYVVDRAFTNSSLSTQINLGVPATNPLCNPADLLIPAANDAIAPELQCFAKQLTKVSDEGGVIETGGPNEIIFDSVPEQCQSIFDNEALFTRKNYCSRYCASYCSTINYQNDCYSELCDEYCAPRCESSFITNPDAKIGPIVRDYLIPNKSSTCEKFGNVDANFNQYTFGNYCTDCTNYCTYKYFDRDDDISDICRNDLCAPYCASKCYDVIGKGEAIIPNFYENQSNKVKSDTNQYNKCIKGDHNINNFSYKIYCTNACEHFNQNGSYTKATKLNNNKKLKAECFDPVCDSFCQSMIVGTTQTIHEPKSGSLGCFFIGLNGLLQTEIDPKTYCKPECFAYNNDENYSTKNITWGNCFDNFCRNYCALYKDGELDDINYGSNGDTRYYPQDEDKIVDNLINPFVNGGLSIYNRLCSITPLSETYHSYCSNECPFYCENDLTYLSNDGCHKGICDEYCSNICQDLLETVTEILDAGQDIKIYESTEDGAAVVNDRPVYLLISHNYNAFGAFSRSADNTSTGGTGPALERLSFEGASEDEMENLDCVLGNCGNFKINSKFISRLIDEEFDDLVFYDTRYGMILKCNKFSNNICSSETGHNMLLN